MPIDLIIASSKLPFFILDVLNAFPPAFRYFLLSNSLALGGIIAWFFYGEFVATCAVFRAVQERSKTEIFDHYSIDLVSYPK